MTNILTDTYQERILSVLPFFHIYGFNGILNGVLAHGLHMITIPKFTPELYIECVLKYKVCSRYKLYRQIKDK